MGKTHYVRGGLRGLAKALGRDLPKVRKDVVKAAKRAAIKTAHHVAQNMPVAFAELRASLHVDMTGKGPRVVADAPHAAAVEVGSRPHTPPLQPLVDWVKLRGMQGIDKRGYRRRMLRKAWGTTTAKHSHRVASELKQLQQHGRTKNDDRYLDVSAPISLARAIQMAIRKRGTKPHFYMRNAIPFARRALNLRIRAALKGEGD